MKKDIEWLKDEILTEMQNLESTREIQQVDMKYQTLRKVAQKINQLDETEVLSQEWISENVEYAYFDMLDGSGRLSSATAIIKPKKLKNLLVPKQTLPVIPQFVAEFLIGKEDYMLYELFDDGWLYENHDRVAKWLYDNDELTNKQREIDLVMARDRGYVVEEEQKYVLLINITDKASRTDYETFLNKRGIFHSMENESFNSEEFNWSEEEIKDLENGEILFEHFAVKVEEG